MLLTTRSRARVGALLICGFALSALSGCSLWHGVFHHRDKNAPCTQKPFVANTENRPPLKVPEGLSAPDTRNAVKVPGDPNAVPAGSVEPCLARPPSYFATPLKLTLPTPPPKPKHWWQFWRKKPAPAPAAPADAAPAASAPAASAPATPASPPAPTTSTPATSVPAPPPDTSTPK